MNNKVSIIVPIYNAAVFLSKTITSILNQTYPNLEIILVNDCSTDESLQICHRFAAKDSRINIIDKKVNEGEDYARFSGINVATGDYLMFLDSDDWFMPDAVYRVLNLAISNDVDIVYANSIRVYSSKLHISRFKEFDRQYTDRVITGKEKRDLFKSYFGVNIVPVTMWGNIFKRKLFDTGLKRSGLKMGADLALSMQLYDKAEKIYLTSAPILYYRWGGVTAGFQPKFIECAKVLYSRKCEYIRNGYIVGERTSIIELANCLASYVLSLVTYTKNHDEHIRKVKAEMADPVYNDFEKVRSDLYFKVGDLNEACMRRDFVSAVAIAERVVSQPSRKVQLIIKKFAAKFLKYIRL